MRVLVTGGAGYIGSHTVRLLMEQGYVVSVLDNMEKGHIAAVWDVPLIVGDVRDQALVERILNEHGIEAVIHFAAYKAPSESMERPARYFENNVIGTLSLLQAMRKAEVRYIVFSSSCSVYGTPKVLPVTEGNALHPESPYAESKLMVEQILKWFEVCHDMRYVSLRYFNAAGAALDGSIGEDITSTLNLIPMIMKAVLGKKSVVQVFGSDYPTPDGTAIRDYIHVLDLAAAHIKSLEYLRMHDRSDILNLGTGKGTSVQQILDLTHQITHIHPPVQYEGRRPGDPAAIWADNTKACTLLGWRPKYDLEHIIHSAWMWHSAHPDGYAELSVDGIHYS